MQEADRTADVGQALQVIRERIAAATGPAFLIDPVTARVLAGNDVSHLHFPALAEGRTAALDGSMPAIRDLRAFAAQPERPASAIPLTFWTALGVRTWRCDLERVTLGDQAGVFLVAEMMQAAGVPAPVDGSPPMSHRSDGETLREIARRIWEGQSRRETGPGAQGVPGEIAPLKEHAAMSAGPDASDPPMPPDGGVVRDDDPPAIPSASQSPLAAQPIDLAKLAHELKTPVSAISAAAEIMKDERFGPVANSRYAGYIADIHTSAQHALMLIERMLNRPTEHAVEQQAPLQFTRFDLAGLVTECVSSVAPLAEAKGVTLARTPSRSDVFVTADATSVRQIVLNLVTNAIKFTPARGRISVETILARDGAPVLRVADTGPGMTAVAITEAMRPVPLNVPARRDGGGLGLGLPLAYALAEANGASMAIESAPDQGTDITITFPHGRLIAI